MIKEIIKGFHDYRRDVIHDKEYKKAVLFSQIINDGSWKEGSVWHYIKQRFLTKKYRQPNLKPARATTLDLIDSRVNFRFWMHEIWDDSKSPLVPVFFNAVDGVDPTVACTGFEQWTGIRDVKGRPIYEGDVVEHVDSKEKCKIFWDHLDASFVAINLVTPEETYTLNFDEKCWKIIGNIHEKEYKCF